MIVQFAGFIGKLADCSS